MPDSMTQILSSGPPGTKVNIAVLGDGFADGADQTTYNNKVNDLLFNVSSRRASFRQWAIVRRRRERSAGAADNSKRRHQRACL